VILAAKQSFRSLVERHFAFAAEARPSIFFIYPTNFAFQMKFVAQTEQAALVLYLLNLVSEP